MKLKIGCDIDGILADCAGALIRYNQERGLIARDVSDSDPPDYLMSTTYPGMSFDCFKNPGFWRNLNPFPGAKDFMDRLRTLGEVILISHCPEVVGRCEWLRRHGFSETGFIPANGEERAALVDALDLHVFIDDSPDNLRLLIDTKAAVLGRRWAYNAHLSGERVFLGDYAEMLDRVRGSV